MLKRILAVSLALNFSLAAEAASPITLLSQQCIDYQVSLSQAQVSITPMQASIELERQLIGLFNLKDSVRFYRQYPLSADDKEALLQCQLHLADEFARLTQSPWIIEQSQLWTQNEQPGLRRFGHHLIRQLKEQISLEQKSRIHTAQASVAHGLRQKNLSLALGASHCELQHQTEHHSAFEDDTKSFDRSIASYLIAQQDISCKRQVWQAYQTRAKERNQAAVSQILSTKQEIAQQHQAPDYAHWVLSSQLLKSPAQVKRYLDTMTQTTIAPWMLGTQLASLPKADIAPVSAANMLEQIEEKLSPFGLLVEPVNHKMSRLWHHGRLLGDIFLATTPDIRVSPLRQAVIGQQFGQLTLSSPEQLEDYRAQEQFITSIAELVARMLPGGHYYLNNTLGDTQDTQALASQWLTLYLTGQLLPTLPIDSREAQLEAFSTQLKVFRSKLALIAYQTKAERSYQDLSQEFALSFGEPWPQAYDALYSFTGAVNQGPLYYLVLWKKSLAKQIQAQSRLDTQALFDLLLVNEQQLSLDDQLTLIFGDTTPVVNLLERRQHVQHSAIH
ncbi:MULTISPECIES: hypothetical protein [Shewanella]|uniref:Zn-dependent oligopeptidase n=1 Tax=Shewanella marisflavi TaxID=260364 RepID=A0ABX5WNL1_9GAMM|nr:MULTISPECIES: hypothetical protein [Shewanella]QDF75205.1 Zn-dependent oligopeptidase [Shewanella marisflavi]